MAAKAKNPGKAKGTGKGKLKVTQTGSPIGRPGYQRATLVSLGLNKLRRSKVVADTPENRGRITKVQHLIEVEPA